MLSGTNLIIMVEAILRDIIRITLEATAVLTTHTSITHKVITTQATPLDIITSRIIHTRVTNTTKVLILRVMADLHHEVMGLLATILKAAASVINKIHKAGLPEVAETMTGLRMVDRDLQFRARLHRDNNNRLPNNGIQDLKASN